ncbi:MULTISPECIES: DUF6058 family natural product biosynthesis protein [unclassified Streptomyces]|uniref:DUF6058 family natural product biosynthesis protein n=1 Tax=unclassified Streptomyces TaxID=2593676 RepID=UPI0006F4151E|nr:MULTISPECIES: DUF6058 family natural product biosynthesis protein [unclassified Streptomyces]KQX49864.1 hypothetical protein ASD33_14510 [Streptomyces sp. Root1304]KRA80093.1 hypothetical protein ASE09_18400 [Streptomyces sp. Root66D1]
MTDRTLVRRIAERFREVNGDHPMTAADDAYVTGQFVALEALCASRCRDADEARRLMLAGLLPLPGYLRSDGTEMVPCDLFRLTEAAGGSDRLRAWFTGHWEDGERGEAEWRAYLSGQYVCLHSVTPAHIRRKDELATGIAGTLESAPADPSPEWRAALHARVDELDALEPAFTAYDRLRFGGPTSRDTCVDRPRVLFPAGGPGV